MPSRGEPAGGTHTGKERPPIDPTEAVGHAYVFLFHAVAAVAIAGTISEAGEVKGRGTRAARGGATRSCSLTNYSGQLPGQTGHRHRPGLMALRAYALTCYWPSPARTWLRPQA